MTDHNCAGWDSCPNPAHRQPTLSEFLLARIGEDEVDYSTHGIDRGWSDDFIDKLLAECEAKRRIVELRGHVSEPEGLMDRLTFPTIGAALDAVLRLMALPYAEHADYRAEWKP